MGVTMLIRRASVAAISILADLGRVVCRGSHLLRQVLSSFRSRGFPVLRREVQIQLHDALAGMAARERNVVVDASDLTLCEFDGVAIVGHCGSSLDEKLFAPGKERLYVPRTARKLWTAHLSSPSAALWVS